MPNAELTHHQSMRYSRHIMLPAMDFEGQEKLLAAKILVVGMGGLGCACAPYLASGGVGQLTLADDDVIEFHNLQRQILFTEQDIGQAKAEVAARHLRRLNSEIRIDSLVQRLDAEALDTLVANHDLVVDCCDNLATRNLINQACHRAKTPLISGAAIRMEGQLAYFSMQPETPCYACFSQFFGEQDLSCMEAGVLAPVVGVIGSLQATMAMQVLAGIGSQLEGQVTLFDATRGDWQQFKLTCSPTCPVCAGAR
ncbi:MAG: molybdopterin-synthase adenylyltransferase MoeB [Idiomarina sp.]|nr:molybdopterin-synthase adenylyltransferase MoeB [Idiomarina sp.]